MSTPLLSIIIPSYNNGKELEELLTSISKQTFKSFEIIIVDGKSNDNTSEVASKFQNLIGQFVSEPDQGIFDAMNKGIKYSKGLWLYFIGTDDQLYNNMTLEELFLKIKQDSDIVYGNVFNEHKKRTEGSEIRSQEELLKTNLWHQSMFFRKSVFDKVGLYNIKYKIAADTVFNLIAYCQHNFNWQYINQTVSIFSGTGISSSQYDLDFHHDQYDLYFKCFDKVEKQKVYEALQHHLYAEIKSGSILKAIREFLYLAAKSRKPLLLARHSLHFLKLRFKS